MTNLLASGSPVAAIDIGTNSVKCLVARVHAGHINEVLLDALATTRLGQELQEGGRLRPDAVDRTARAVADFAATAHRLGADRIRVTGTSALRDAGSEDDVCVIRSAAGVDVEILSGEQEARLSYLGAVDPGVPRAAIFDVGGGSTEWAIGEFGSVTWKHSYPAGAVRFTEAFLHSDPPSRGEVDAARSAARELFREAVYLEGIPVVGVGGTVRALAVVSAGGDDQVEGLALRRVTLAHLIEDLAGRTIAQRREVPGMPPDRADVIVAGAVVLHEAMARARVEVVNCTVRGLRHGVVKEMDGASE